MGTRWQENSPPRSSDRISSASTSGRSRSSCGLAATIRDQAASGSSDSVAPAGPG